MDIGGQPEESVVFALALVCSYAPEPDSTRLGETREDFGERSPEVCFQDVLCSRLFILFPRIHTVYVFVRRRQSALSVACHIRSLQSVFPLGGHRHISGRQLVEAIRCRKPGCHGRAGYLRSHNFLGQSNF